MQSPLAERPIFRRLKHRVEAHTFVCLLAFHPRVANREDFARSEGSHLLGNHSRGPQDASGLDRRLADSKRAERGSGIEQFAPVPHEGYAKVL
jgi:hypothetical protein